MAENDEDENLKRAKASAEMVRVQNKMKDYQDKLVSLQNKEYQGKVQGITIVMKGSEEVIDIRIEQSYYETAGKGQMEKALLTLLNNLHRAVEADQTQIKEEMQAELVQLQKEQSDGTH
jgi:DNA-binding protein YbaB